MKRADKRRRDWHPQDPVVQKIAEYLTLEKRRSERTVREYCREAEMLGAFVAGQPLVIVGRIPNRGPFDGALLKVTPTDLRRYLMEATSHGMGAAAIRRKTAAFKTMFGYLRREALVASNPTLEMGNIKPPKRLPKGLAVGDVMKLLHTASPAGTSESQRRRDGAILELLYASGIRRAELAGLSLSDIDLKRRTARVIGKGDKERVVLFNKAAAEALRRYLEVRPSAPDGALFVSRLGKRLSYPQIGRIFELYVRLSKLEGKITPHTMRHSFATHLHQHGVDIMTIKELLGHESVSTTQIYAKASLEHMRQAYEEGHPRDVQRK